MERGFHEFYYSGHARKTRTTDAYSVNCALFDSRDVSATSDACCRLANVVELIVNVSSIVADDVGFVVVVGVAAAAAAAAAA